MLRPKTLFARTVTIIAVVSIAFLLFALTVIGYFMLVPVGKQSADDLAALMLFSVDVWSDLEPDERASYERYLRVKYQLSIGTDKQLEPLRFKSLPYYYFLESSLESRTGKPIHLEVSREEGGVEWYWFEIANDDQVLHVGFPSSHIDAQPPLVLLLLLIVGGFATLVTAAALVRYLTTPLECLSRNALRIGSGEKPELVPETGPDEIATLAQSFNRMAVQVKELLSNRTTLLAGISHDLRTPLARIQLALEMLPENADPVLVNGIRGDVNQMNCLIGQFLDLSRTLEEGEQQKIDIVDVLEDLVSCGRRGGARINWQPGESCYVISNPLALRRIIVNLMENAVRYGEGHAVDVNYFCDNKFTVIKIMDRGQGIPAKELKAVFTAFYRIDPSRNIETGGTGLGLTIAQQLAELNKIKLNLYAREGGGTVADVSIPHLNRDESV